MGAKAIATGERGRAQLLNIARESGMYNQGTELRVKNSGHATHNMPL